MNMIVTPELEIRCELKCELCGSESQLAIYVVAPKEGESIDEQIAVCSTCEEQVNDDVDPEINHWRCLNECIWSPVPAVQVVAYRMLQHFIKEDWAQDLLNMIYLDEDTLKWAEALSTNMEHIVLHKDSNGKVLEAGDTVVLIKDLNVKGANFVAKRGTAVRRISLVTDNPEHIQGRVNDQTIIILTKFVKKQ